MDLKRLFTRSAGRLPENDPLDLFRRFSTDASNRAAIRSALLRCDLYVKGTSGKPQTLTSNANLRVVAYSSLVILSNALQEERDFFQIKLADLLRTLSPDAGILLNPLSNSSMEFSPQQLRDFSVGVTTEGQGEDYRQVKYPKGKAIHLGQPAARPQKMLDALAAYLKTDSRITKAYLAQIFVEGSGEPPHCVVGIEMNPESSAPFEEATPRLASVCNEALAQGQFVDLVDMNRGGVIAQYILTETKPFYDRTLDRS